MNKENVSEEVKVLASRIDEARTSLVEAMDAYGEQLLAECPWKAGDRWERASGEKYELASVQYYRSSYGCGHLRFVSWRLTKSTGKRAVNGRTDDIPRIRTEAV